MGECRQAFRRVLAHANRRRVGVGHVHVSGCTEVSLFYVCLCGRKLALLLRSVERLTGREGGR